MVEGGTDDGRPSTRPPIGLIFAITATGIMANSLIAPVVPDIIDDFGVSDARAGVIISSVALPGIVMAPVIGLAADRIGRRRVLVPCLMLFGLAGLVVASAPDLRVLLLGRFLQGIGAAGLINLAVVLIGDHWTGEDRTRLIGRNAAVLTIGLATFPLLAGVLTEIGGWRLGLAPQAASIVTGVIAWRLLDDRRPTTPGSLGEQLSGLRTALGNRTIIAIIISGFVVFVLIFGIFLAALPVHLERVFGLGSAGRGLVLSIPAVTASLIAFNLSRITARLGYRTTLIAATAVVGLAFTVLGLVPALVVVGLAGALYGLGDGALIPLLQDSAVSESPDAQRGGVVAFWVAAARLGQTVGPLLAAAVFAATSTATTMVGGGVIALGLALTFLAGPIGRHRPSARLPTGR